MIHGTPPQHPYDESTGAMPTELPDLSACSLQSKRISVGSPSKGTFTLGRSTPFVRLNYHWIVRDVLSRLPLASESDGIYKRLKTNTSEEGGVQPFRVSKAELDKDHYVKINVENVKKAT